MRLINLQHTDNAYVAKAQVTFKAFGVALGQRSKIYTRKESDNSWREKKTNRKVSPREAAHLNKWLSDHQKFVEH